jgi:hypothetical protein
MAEPFHLKQTQHEGKMPALLRRLPACEQNLLPPHFYVLIKTDTCIHLLLQIKSATRYRRGKAADSRAQIACTMLLWRRTSPSFYIADLIRRLRESSCKANQSRHGRQSFLAFGCFMDCLRGTTATLMSYANAEDS